MTNAGVIVWIIYVYIVGKQENMIITIHILILSLMDPPGF